MAPGLHRFEIQLDNPAQVFTPGQVIAGRVIVHLNRPKTIRGLKVRILGKAEVRWSESSGSGKNKRTTHYSNDEEYFRMDFFLVGGALDSENKEIEPGFHSYPFNFSLPQNIPSSLETLHGSVRYTIKAVLDRPWKFDHDTTLAFIVEAPNYLSQFPNAMIQIDDEEVASFCCFGCYSRGALRVHIFVPTSGYSIGDAIQAKIQMTNMSTSVDVTKVEIGLKRKITHIARTPRSKTKIQKEILQKAEENGPFSKNEEVVLSMQVPSVPGSQFPNCSCINIDYFLKVTLTVSGCHCAVKHYYPIFIGSRAAFDAGNAQNAAINPLAVPTAPFFPAEASIPYGDGLAPYFPNPSDAFPPGNQAPFRPIGFVPPEQTSGSTEKPPPSYNEVMAGSDTR